MKSEFTYVAKGGTEFYQPFHLPLADVIIKYNGRELLCPVSDLLEYVNRTIITPFLESQEGKTTIEEIAKEFLKLKLKFNSSQGTL